MIRTAQLSIATTDRHRDAAIASVVINVLTAPLFFVLPGADEAPTGAIIFGFVVTAAAAVGAWGLWQGRRWGWRTTFIATLLNVLSSAPAIAAWPSAWVGVTCAVLTVVGIALLVVLRRPDVRISR
ncbi:MAG: hypothetical protein AB7V43_08120 [Acidimicrobiia bacterium]